MVTSHKESSKNLPKIGHVARAMKARMIMQGVNAGAIASDWSLESEVA